LVKVIWSIGFGKLDTVKYSKVTRTAVHRVATIGQIARKAKSYARKAN